MRRYLAASAGCGAVVAATTIAAAVVLAHVVADVITGSGHRPAATWLPALIALAALYIVRAGAQWAQGRLSQRGATALIADLGGRVLQTVTARSPRRLAADRDAAAVVVSRGLDGLRPYFTAFLPAVLLAALVTPAAVLTIAAYDWPSAVIVLIALPLIPLFMVLIGMLTRDRSAAALAALTTLQSRLMDLIAGIPTLRAVGRAEGAATRITELSAAHRRSALATLRIAFLSALVLELIATLGVALVAVSVGLRLVFGELPLSAGLTALLLAPEVFWPLRRVGVEFHAAQDGKAAADRAFALLDGPTERPSAARRIPLAGATIRVEFLDADFAPGEVAVLTGPNGSGKSTTLHAILGLTAPPSGRVLIGGVDIAEADLSAWWAQVSWLAHRPVVVPGTVRENLELFGPLTDVDAACRAAGFDAVLDDLPDGWATVIGRDGTGLSLGQRQRLGLARALGSAAPVLLLDEPTAHLDAVMEARVLEAIRARARAGATVVMVGHRDPVLAVADRVVPIGGDVLVHH
jgi:ATP-binding cassette subfamily C protein CydD